MNAATQEAGQPPRPPDLHFTMTGERFEFLTSAKGAAGVFRFRWTLAGGKKGPPEHLHDEERETFAVESGTLRIWLDGVPRDLHAGESVTVEPGVRHRFLNPTSDSVVVDVGLDGPRQEDVLVPLAMSFGGRRTMTLGDFCVMIVHSTSVQGSRPPSKVGVAVMSGLAGFMRIFGVRPLSTVDSW